MDSGIFEADHDAYRETVRSFLQREVIPHYDRWEEQRLVDRDAWKAAGAAGILGLSVPADHGGAGVTDRRFRYVVAQEFARSGVASFAAGVGTHDDVVLPYVVDLGSVEQKQQWLPGMSSGELIGAISMTEPDTGSDLQRIKTTAVRDGQDWILNGQKTFVTNGVHADVVVVVARTDPQAASKGFSLFLVDTQSAGFEKGRKLRKVGLAAQDTAEFALTDVRLPGTALLGEESHGLAYLFDHLPLERLSIAVAGIASARAAYEWTVDYVFEREAFGQRVGDFQATRFSLAEMLTQIEVTESHIDRCVLAYNAGTLSAVDAAKAKWWATELQTTVTDRCVQLHGGYGYMMEFPIGRSFVDGRIQTIYGGTTEIMKEIIGRDIAKRR